MKPPVTTHIGKLCPPGLKSHPSPPGTVDGGCPGNSEATVSILEDEGAGEGAAGSLGLTPLCSDTLSLANFT